MKQQKTTPMMIAVAIILVFAALIGAFRQTNTNTNTNTAQPQMAVVQDGAYTSPENVAAYIEAFGKLPSNFITKAEAEKLGWKSRDGNLAAIAPGRSIGGDHFGNYEGRLPKAGGRKYIECDVNYVSGYRGGERVIFSNDGLIFYTNDHYATFTQLK